MKRNDGDKWSIPTPARVPETKTGLPRGEPAFNGQIPAIRADGDLILPFDTGCLKMGLFWSSSGFSDFEATR